MTVSLVPQNTFHYLLGGTSWQQEVHQFLKPDLNYYTIPRDLTKFYNRHGYALPLTLNFM